MIRFACPACHAVMSAPPAKVGSKVACLKCGQRLQIPPPPTKTVLAMPLPPKEPPAPAREAVAAQRQDQGRIRAREGRVSPRRVLRLDRGAEPRRIHT